VGILLVRKLSRAATTYGPEGLSRSASSLAESIRDLATSIRSGMDERERELRVALGVDDGTLDPEVAQSLIDDPTGLRQAP
jgi:hypothetical protein